MVAAGGVAVANLIVGSSVETRFADCNSPPGVAHRAFNAEFQGTRSSCPLPGFLARTGTGTSEEGPACTTSADAERSIGGGRQSSCHYPTDIEALAELGRLQQAGKLTRAEREEHALVVAVITFHDMHPRLDVTARKFASLISLTVSSTKGRRRRRSSITKRRTITMSAKNDVRESIVAEVSASREAVVSACRRAVESLGKHAAMEANSTEVTVVIMPGMSQKLSQRSPVVYVRLAPVADGRIQVTTAVGPYRTVQSKMFMFIPAGPKRLVGRSYFFKLLDALELELGALDPVGGAVSRAHAAA